MALVGWRELTASPTTGATARPATRYRSPTGVQVTLSVDIEPKKYWPVRTIRNHSGVAGELTFVGVAVLPPALGRFWKVAPDGVFPTNTLAEFASAVWRTMMPALAYGSMP